MLSTPDALIPDRGSSILYIVGGKYTPYWEYNREKPFMKTVRRFGATALIIAMIAGCMTGGPGHSVAPEDTIARQLDNWRVAMANKDIDAIMAFFSDNFEHDGLRDKSGARMFIAEAIELGYLDGLNITLDDARIKADGDVGSVYPVVLTGSFGSLSMELIVGRFNGAWLLTGLDAPGL